MAKDNRVYLLDALRGAAVLGMIVHHGYILLEFTREVYIPFFYSGLFEVLQMLFVCVFLLVSGICTNYSRNVAKRGLLVFGAAIIVTLVTAGLLPMVGIGGLEIYFGILHMFGLSMLIYALLSPALKKCNPLVISIICLVLFVVYLFLMERWPFAETPWNVGMLFGFPSENFYSADYYPILPYFFVFVAGAMLGRPISEGRFPTWFYDFRCRPLEFVGRHSLLIYLLHQPCIFVLIFVISWIVELF